MRSRSDAAVHDAASGVRAGVTAATAEQATLQAKFDAQGQVRAMAINLKAANHGCEEKDAGIVAARQEATALIQLNTALKARPNVLPKIPNHFWNTEGESTTRTDEFERPFNHLPVFIPRGL